MKKKEIIIRKFEELDEEEREKVLSEFREVLVGVDWFSYILEDFINQVKEELDLDISINDIEFGLYRDSSFGVHTEGLFSQLRDKYEEVDDIYGSKKLGIFYREFPTLGIFETNYEDFVMLFKPDVSEERKEEVKSELNNIFAYLVKLCRDYYSKLKESYKELTSDDYIIDWINENGVMFDERLNPYYCEY